MITTRIWFESISFPYRFASVIEEKISFGWFGESRAEQPNLQNE